MRVQTSLRLKLMIRSLFVFASLLGSNIATPPAQAQSSGGNETLFSIPVGAQGIQYEGVGVQEMLRWGPTALAVAPDGSFWIADTAARRILHYTVHGVPLGVIDTRNHVVGIMDMEATASDLWVLDASAITPVVLRLRFDGTVLGTYEVPAALQRGLTGIARGDAGEVLLERENGRFVDQLIDAAGKLQLQQLPGYLRQGRLYHARSVEPAINQGSRGTITAGATTIDVHVPHDLAGLSILGVGRDDSVYAVVGDMVIDGGIRVDQTVHHYGADSTLLGMARVPLAEQYVPVPQALAVGPDQQVYVLVTRPDRVDIQRLRFAAQLAPLLPDVVQPQAERPQTGPSALRSTGTLASTRSDSGSPSACISRSSIISQARNYAFGAFPLSAINLDGACSGRGKPRFLGGAWPTTGMAFQYYVPMVQGPTTGSAAPPTGMAFDWGGWDTIDGYQAYMRQGLQAGDIDIHNPVNSSYGEGVEACSRGVDCSGFLTRAWGISAQKYGTYALLDLRSLKPGDILNDPVRHVALVDTISADGRGVWVYESTTFDNRDRVIYMYHDWSYFSTYQPRRYINLCNP